MNKKIKKMWVDALNSEKYEQGTGCLKKDNKFCCLGVLCELHRKTMKKSGWKNSSRKKEQYLGESLLLPNEVFKWAGLNQYTPGVGDAENTLSSLNDNGKSFEYIADQIEKYL